MSSRQECTDSKYRFRATKVGVRAIRALREQSRSVDENDSDEILTDHRLRSCKRIISQAAEGKISLLLADRAFGALPKPMC
jgi:hypothetical protein